MTGPKATLELVSKLRASRHAEGSSLDRACAHGVTDTGAVRTHNEDQFLIARLDRALHVEQTALPIDDGTRFVDDPPARLLMVADGMGGHAAGEVASAVVVDTMVTHAFALLPWWTRGAIPDELLASAFREAVGRAQARVVEVAEAKGLSTNLGTTLTMAYVVWPRVYLVHIGDSRAYLSRGGELYRLTRDHTAAQQLVEAGMPQEQADDTPWAHVLTNCIGGGSKDVDAELHRFDLEPGDVLLLCTDGLYNELSDADIGSRLSHVPSDEFVEPCVRSLVDEAKRAGGRDNITAVLTRF